MASEQYICEIPESTPMTDIKLPNEWVLYLYDKQSFKKMVNKPNYKVKPYTEVCTLRTINDLMYILQLMEVALENNIATNNKIGGKRNLDANDYIIMKKGIEPIWEDPRNSNGGTFSIKMSHQKGYDVWMTFLLYMIGDTMSDEMNYINGITASFIPDTNSFSGNGTGAHTNYTYIKIWDGKEGRTKDDFVKILPPSIIEKIGSGTLRYTLNVEKPDYNGKDIMAKLNNNRSSNRGKQFEKGGFISPRGRR